MAQNYKYSEGMNQNTWDHLLRAEQRSEYPEQIAECIAQSLEKIAKSMSNIEQSVWRIEQSVWLKALNIAIDLTKNRKER